MTDDDNNDDNDDDNEDDGNNVDDDGARDSLRIINFEGLTCLLREKCNFHELCS